MERKFCLRKKYSVIIISSMFFLSILFYFAGLVGGLFEFSNARTFIISYLKCLAFSAPFVCLMIVLWHRQLTETFLVDDEGMRLIRFKKVFQSIKWNEIMEAKRVPVGFDARFNFSIANRNEYLVFAASQVFDDYRSNSSMNLCIWRPNEKIFDAIKPYLAKLKESHQKEVENFFE
jgi:hypothetical protein